MELEEIPFDISPLAEEVSEILSVKAFEKNIQFLLNIAPNLQRYLIGDPGRIRQLLYNLAGNAVKFTSEGHVKIAITSATNQTAEKVKIRIAIEDTGVGIAQDKIEAIFEKFSQADKSTNRNFGGTGLGLAICRQLTSLMNGRVWAESILESGTTFFAEIELTPNKDNIISETSAVLRGKVVCIAEKNPASANIIKQHILSMGGLPIVVDSLANVANESYIYICDDDLAKSSPDPAKTIVHTNVAVYDSSDTLKKAGFKGILAKPLHNDEFIKTIEAYNKGEESFISRATTYSGTTRDNKSDKLSFDNTKILLVEDNLINLQIAKQLLEKYNCNVSSALNGRLAVEAVEKDDYDLIFMDCQMPEMDGFEASGKIREFEEKSSKKRCPIVAFTANAMKGDREKCLDAGMDDYISKPVKRDALERVLNTWLNVENTAETLESKPLPKTQTQ